MTNTYICHICRKLTWNDVTPARCRCGGAFHEVPPMLYRIEYEIKEEMLSVALGKKSTESAVIAIASEVATVMSKFDEDEDC